MKLFLLPDIKARKTWLYAAISGAVALIFMVLQYVHWTPKEDVRIRIEPFDANVMSQGAEFRINYIMVDDEYVPLKMFATDDWQYDGSLVTYSYAQPLEITVQANRIVEVGFKRGPWMARGNIQVGANHETVDLYSENDDTQHLETVPIHSFVRPISVIVGFFAFLLIFTLLHLALHRHHSQYWNNNIDLGGSICAIVLFMAVILLMNHSYIFPYRKAGLVTFDVGAYTAVGKFIAGGKMPYLDVVEGKGVVFYFLIALGAKLWWPHGIWIVETALNLGAYIFLFLAFGRYFSRRVALLGILLSVAYQASVYQDGTSTESFSMVFICAGIYVAAMLFSSNYNIAYRWIFIFGACFAVILHIRQNNAYIYLPIVIMLAVSQLRQKKFKLFITQIAMMAIGFFVIYTVPLFWLVANNAFFDWFEQCWLYLFNYASENSLSLVGKIGVGLSMMAQSGIKYLIPVAVSLFAYILSTIIKFKKTEPLIVLLLSGFVVGIIFCTVSGYRYPHYIQPLAPLIGLCGAYIVNLLYRVFITNHIVADIISTLLIASMTVSVYTGFFESSWYKSRFFDDTWMTSIRIANYIDSNTVDGEKWLLYNLGGEYNQAGFVIQNLATTFGYRYQWGQYRYMRDDTLHNENYYEYIKILDSSPNFIVVSYEPDNDLTNYIHTNYTKVIDGNIDLWRQKANTEIPIQ